MAEPKGTLTGSQLEIMEALWSAGPEGLGASEIWQALSSRREVGRTTVLTLVSRLEKRGWLIPGKGRGARYRPVLGRQEASQRLAAEFTEAFFDGSASQLVMSLLGSKRIKPEELRRLRQLLEETS